LMALQIVASERVEVVELHTVDSQGEEVSTRLWVVDDGGFAYLRAGVSEGSGWYSRLQQNGDVALTRAGERRNYRTVLRPDKADVINRLMREKYTWGDWLIEVLIGGREGSMPVELHRL
ncbi:MAG: hypothetical protein RL120_17205, partial [Gammaproteobacteria bacterium]